MKKFLSIIAALLISVSGAWAETWESKEGFVQASGGVGSFTWYGVHTPGNASTTYSLTSIKIMQQTGNGNNDNYLAIARVSATSTLSAAHVVAISDNHLAASQSSGSLETYNFSEGVDLPSILESYSLWYIRIWQQCKSSKLVAILYCRCDRFCHHGFLHR